MHQQCAPAWLKRLKCFAVERHARRFLSLVAANHCLMSAETLPLLSWNWLMQSTTHAQHAANKRQSSSGKTCQESSTPVTTHSDASSARLLAKAVRCNRQGGRWSNAGCVYGPSRTVAWRTLDAQYFGLAKQRRRVFVVASSRTGFDPFAILFEREGVRRDTAPSREAREGAAIRAENGVDFRGWPSEVACTLNAAYGEKLGLENQHVFQGAWLFVPHPVIAFHVNAQASQLPSEGRDTSVTAALTRSQYAGVATKDAVRRLMPVECERLQGFNDNYTAIPWNNRTAEKCADNPRCKAIGNSWAVPCVRWIGQRIERALRTADNDNSTPASEAAA